MIEGGKLHSPASLKGKRISMIRASVESYLVEKLLNKAGLRLDDIEVKDVPAPAKLEALKRGSIDLAFSGDPWLTRLLRTGDAVLWMPAQKVIPDFQFAFILYGPTLLEANPDAGRRFMVAYLKAVRQYNQGKTDRNVEILAQHIGQDRELLRQACWPAIRNDSLIQIKSVLDFQDWAVRKGLLDSPLRKEQFSDPTFLEHANQVLKTGAR